MSHECNYSKLNFQCFNWSRNFQIITVGLFPLDAGEKEYIERWEIEFTINQSKSRVFIELEGYPDIPKLFFGNDGVVDIGAVYPQCERTMTLAMRNISRHRLQLNIIINHF